LTLEVEAAGSRRALLRGCNPVIYSAPPLTGPHGSQAHETTVAQRESAQRDRPTCDHCRRWRLYRACRCEKRVVPRFHNFNLRGKNTMLLPLLRREFEEDGERL
jgi:hypothetical protein